MIAESRSADEWRAQSDSIIRGAELNSEFSPGDRSWGQETPSPDFYFNP
jgi:hypothetical protein